MDLITCITSQFNNPQSETKINLKKNNKHQIACKMQTFVWIAKLKNNYIPIYI